MKDESAATGDQRGGIGQSVGQVDGATVAERQPAVSQFDGTGTGKTPFINQGERRAINQSAACIGVIAVERQGPRSGLIKEDAPCAGGKITSPGRVGVDADEGGRGAGAAVYDDAAAGREGRTVR